ncbi:MAG: hypothetical protein WC975_07340 [Phycisphaerae bacterium]
MNISIFIRKAGVPTTGLTLAWTSLRCVPISGTGQGVDKLSSAPAIYETGGGWYRFSLTYGTVPFDAPMLTGVIDAGSSFSDAERYIPFEISLRDLAPAKLVNKATYDLVSGIESIRNDDDTGNELRMSLSQEGNVETRQILD